MLTSVSPCGTVAKQIELSDHFMNLGASLAGRCS
jgi:hypothetical protein